MAELPDMPALPPPGQQADALAEWNADGAANARARGNLSMEKRGQDKVQLWKIKASAAGCWPPAIPPGGDGPGGEAAGVQETLEDLQDGVAELRAMGRQILAKLEQMEARLANERRRRQNRLAQQAHPRSDLALVPLVKEQLPPAGAAGAAAPGALPPANMFPQTWADVIKLTAGQLNALAAFYGEQFGPGTLADRRAAFMAFIT